MRAMQSWPSALPSSCSAEPERQAPLRIARLVLLSAAARSESQKRPEGRLVVQVPAAAARQRARAHDCIALHKAIPSAPCLRDRSRYAGAALGLLLLVRSVNRQSSPATAG